MLKDVTYLTSVSGGGYPVFGILTRMATYGDTLDELLGGEQFLVSIEKQSHFIPKYDYYWTLGQDLFFTGFQKIRQAIRTPPVVTLSSGTIGYAVEIQRTFVAKRMWFRSPPLLADITEQHLDGFPYPIFIASANKGSFPPLRNHMYKIGNLFEISPAWIGSDNSGFFDTQPEYLRLDHAITASAAAIDAPELSFDVSENFYDPSRERERNPSLPDIAKYLGFALGSSLFLGDNSEWYLADGGFIDNTGIVPLVRRGCRTVIALDASADENAERESLRLARGYLTEHYGWSIGEESPVGANTSIGSRSGWALPSNIWVAHAKHPKHAEIHIVVMKIGLVKGHEYPNAILEYIKRERDTEHFPGQECIGDGLSKRCPFPLESTVRQSFGQDEFRAYRILGEHLVDLAVREIRQDIN